MHGWTWTREARLRPQRCAVFPHVNSGAFIDTGVDIPDWEPRVYIGDQAAVELGRFVGMVPGEELSAEKLKVAERDEKIAELKQRIQELENFKAAVELIKAEI